MHRRGENRSVVRSIIRALRRSSQHEGLGGVKEPPSGIRELASAGASGQLAARLELRHLRYFAAVVQHETIGRAAEHLDLTQPALSRQLRDLEEIIGVALLNRSPRGVIPTLAGESLNADAVRILRTADQMGPEAQRALRGTSGNCVVGVVASPLVWDVITHAVADCAARLPAVDVAVEDVPTPKQTTALREARLDVALGHRYPIAPELDANLTRSLLLPDMMNTAIVSVNHPLAKKPEISLADLAELPLLFMKRAFSPAFHDVVMSAFAHAHFTPLIDGEYDGLPTVWALASQGMGWCLGMASQREYPPYACVAVKLKDFNLPWGCELVHRRDESRPAVLEVIRALHDAARAIHDAGMTSKEMKYWPQSEQTA
jgi:DNA-binding transcriptional LysR family regulator